MDPIADMLTRIKNAHMVNHETTTMPYSKVKEAIAALLKRYGFIVDFKVISEPKPTLEVTLATEDAVSRLNDLARMSKPGRRLYVASKDIPTIRRGRGLVLVSTSKGIISGAEARKQGLGGELICKVW